MLEPIIPVIPWKPDEVFKALETSMDETLKAARDDFKKTTRTWNTKVDWILITSHRAGTRLEGATGTNNKIYGYVSRGTKPHIIRPKRGRVLSFRSGYRAKTIIRRLGSNAGGAYGAQVFAKQVNHPGNKGREFEEAIADKYQSILQKRMQDAINKAMKVS